MFFFLKNHIYQKRILFFFLFFINNIKISLTVEITRESIESPSLYKNEICSYSGRPSYNLTTGKVTCDCYESFVDEPDEKNIKYINGQKVHCSYKKKKRFTAFFLAALFPMGFDMLYLKRYVYFGLAFSFFILFLICEIVTFVLAYNINEINEDEKNKNDERERDLFTRRNLYFNNKANKKKDKNQKWRNCIYVLNIVNKVMAIMIGIYWITDIILQGNGIVKDGNKIDTENDMKSLFSKEEL